MLLIGSANVEEMKRLHGCLFGWAGMLFTSGSGARRGLKSGLQVIDSTYLFTSESETGTRIEFGDDGPLTTKPAILRRLKAAHARTGKR